MSNGSSRLVLENLAQNDRIKGSVYLIFCILALFNPKKAGGVSLTSTVVFPEMHFLDRDRNRDRERKRETERQRDRERQRESQRDRERQRDRETERHRERYRESETLLFCDFNIIISHVFPENFTDIAQVVQKI